MMEIYTVARVEVEARLYEMGGRVVDIQVLGASERADYRYWAAKG